MNKKLLIFGGILLILIPVVMGLNVGINDDGDPRITFDTETATSRFLDLLDVFETTYSGHAGECVIVNDLATGLIFGNCSNATGSGAVDSVSSVSDYIPISPTTGAVQVDFNESVLNGTIINLGDGRYIKVVINIFDQDLNTTNSVIFDNITASGILAGNGSGIDMVLTDLLDFATNGSQIKGDIIWFNGTGWAKFPRPTLSGSFDLRNTNAGALSWQSTAPPAPSWSTTLFVGRTSGTISPRITEGEGLEYSNGTANVTSYADNKLDLNALGDIELSAGGDVDIDNGFDVILPSIGQESKAFGVQSGTTSRLTFFRTALSAGFIGLITDTAQYLKVYMLGANAGFVYVDDTLGVGGDGNGTVSLTQGDGWFNGTLYADAFITHSPDIRCNLDDNESKNIMYCRGEIREKGVDQLFNITKDWELLSRIVLDPEIQSKLDQKRALSLLTENWRSDMEICKSQGDYYEYVSFREYQSGSRLCLFNQESADHDCQVERNNSYYKYNQGTGRCERDNEAWCERLTWQFWRGNQCNVNDFRECAFNGFDRNESWHEENLIWGCFPDQRIECVNRGFGWSWDDNTKTCEYDDNLNRRQRYNDCLEKGRGWEWNGEQCVEV